MDVGYPDGGEQDFNVKQRRSECLQFIQESNTSVLDVCPRVWDGMLCWPPSLQGKMETLPCPSYIVGFDPTKVASKLCTAEGQWYVSSDTNGTWTNYTQCYTSRMIKVLVRFPDLHNSSLIATYFKLVWLPLNEIIMWSSLVTDLELENNLVTYMQVDRDNAEMRSIGAEIFFYEDALCQWCAHPRDEWAQMEDEFRTSSCSSNNSYHQYNGQYVPLMKTVSRVGYAVSFTTLIIAFCIFATFKRLRCPRNKLHMHLFVSFMMRAFTTLLKDVLFVRGVGLPSDFTFWDGEAYFLHDNEQNWQCKLIISLWQYFIMVNYSWILMEGIYLHNLIFLAVFSDTSAITTYIVLGWGLPVLFVVPWVVVRALWENTLCWTTNTNPNYFLLIKVPTTLSILVNSILFLNIVRLLLSKLMAAISEESRRYRYRRWAKSTLVLVPLFGVHYIVFLLMSYIGVDEKVELVWLFIDQLFTSFQGFLVAILYCILNGEVCSEVARQWERLPLWRARAPSLPLHVLPQASVNTSYLGNIFSRRHKRFNSGDEDFKKEKDCGSTLVSTLANDGRAGSISVTQT